MNFIPGCGPGPSYTTREKLISLEIAEVDTFDAAVESFTISTPIKPGDFLIVFQNSFQTTTNMTPAGFENVVWEDEGDWATSIYVKILTGSEGQTIASGEDGTHWVGGYILVRGNSRILEYTIINEAIAATSGNPSDIFSDATGSEGPLVAIGMIMSSNNITGGGTAAFSNTLADANDRIEIAYSIVNEGAGLNYQIDTGDDSAYNALAIAHFELR